MMVLRKMIPAILRRYISVCHVCRSNRNILRLKDRGVFSDLFPVTSADTAIDVLNGSPQTVYAGFDPTADSLHVGNLAVIVNLLQWQRNGHHVVGLIGGATGQIGDPSGKSTERQQMNRDTVENNSKEIDKLLKKIFKNHEEFLWKKKHPKSSLFPVK